MEKYYIHLHGTGQKNGVVTIDKKFEVEHSEIGKYTNSSTSKEYIQRAIDFYYPGLTSHNVIWAKVITEKIKVPKKPDDFEKFIAGMATGAVIAKSSEPKRRPQQTVTIVNSFSKELNRYSEINFGGKDINETKYLLNQIYNGIADYKWKDNVKDEKANKVIEDNNRALNMCLRNYGVGLKHLKSITDDKSEIEEFSKIFVKLQRKRISNKYGVIIIAVLALVIMMFILYLMDN